MDGFEQQNQNDVAERLRQAMLAAKAMHANEAQAPTTPISPVDAATITGSQQPTTPPVPSSITQSQQPPNVTLAHASRSEQPATNDVATAQANLDQFQHQSPWKKILPAALMLGGSLAASHTRNGAAAQEQASQGIQYLGNRQIKQKEDLVQQLQNAQGRQEQEYEADQRNRQQDLITGANNQMRSLTAQIAANSRQGVAETNVEGRKYTADQNLEGRKYAADTGANARIASSKYAADQAMDRLIYGQNRQDTRQARGIAAGYGKQEQGYQNTLNKPTADEDRRADLANAAIGYADVLKDIMQRRPELFGPVAGRVTNVRNMVGTSDADVATLKYLQEQLGIVQMGAHSMRSAAAIAPIADSLVNSFHNDPAASLSVLENAQTTLKQFTGEQVRPTVNQPTAARPSTPRKPLKAQVSGSSKPPAASQTIVVTPEDLKKATGGK